MKSCSRENRTLEAYLSPVVVCAYSVGMSIGWGSLVVSSGNYLSQAGPAGSIIGLLIGFAMMLMVAGHIQLLAKRYPDAGGIYSYTKNLFGYDRAFIVAWFVFLVYISIFWANATSVPLFVRYFIGDIFRFGKLFTVFDYDVYLGEALLTLVVIGLVALLCIRSRRFVTRFMTGMVLLFTAGITICFVAAMLRHDGSMTFSPAFIPDKNAIQQVVRITFISPWAFIGFEAVTHAAGEFSFKISKLFRILVISLVITTALYIFIFLLSISAYPEDCANWFEYITNLDRYQGIEGLPVFYAANYYLGPTGIYILMASLFSLVLTSLIGMMKSLSRLCYSVALDGILPERFSCLNENHAPVNAILLVMLVSLPIPFTGRTAIGWIVDVTTFGALLIYGFTAAEGLKVAREEKDRLNIITGRICMVIMAAFALYLLFPNLFADHTLSTETYILMTIWTLIGFLYFRRIISKDQNRKFGKAIIVWLFLIGFIVVMAMAWSGRMEEEAIQNSFSEVRTYYSEKTPREIDEDAFIESQIGALESTNRVTTLIIIGLFAMSLGAMLINHYSIRKWEKQAVLERDIARGVAYRDALTGVRSKHAYAEDASLMEEKMMSGEAEPFSIVVCDVNGLKHINDTQGHKAGDAYIKAASCMICEIFAHSPVFRVGGDEFAVLLKGRDYTARQELMKMLHDRSVEHIASNEAVVSGGISDYLPGSDHLMHDVFERADALMYEEKKQLKAMGAVTREGS